MFELYDYAGTGQVILTENDLAGRFIFYQTISGAGSLTDDRFAAPAQLTYVFLPLDYFSPVGPQVSQSGTTVSWTAANGILFLGVV